MSDRVRPSVKVALCIFYRAVRFIILFYATIYGTRGYYALTFIMNVFIPILFMLFLYLRTLKANVSVSQAAFLGECFSCTI